MEKVYCGECKYYYEDWALYSGPENSVVLCRKTHTATFERDESWKGRAETVEFQKKIKPYVHNKNNDCSLFENRKYEYN